MQLMRVHLPLFAAVLAALFSPAAAAAADPFTVKPVLIDTIVGPDNDIACTVSADLYVPAGVTKGNPAAAVMATNGFGGSKRDFPTLAGAYAKRGYVFLAYSGLGFGGSDCKITLDDPDYDGKAGSQLLSFLAGALAAQDGTTVDFVKLDKQGDPRVGMLGGSYGGQIQFAIAGIDPRLDTIVPQITWSDLSYSLTPNNTDFERGVTYRTPGVAKLDWPALFFGLGVARGFENLLVDPARAAPCPNFADTACTSLVSSATLGYPTPETLAFLRHASVASYVSKIRIPTFLSQGQSDNLFNLQEAIATWSALRGQGTPVKMLWRSRGHSGGDLDGEWSEESPEGSYESRMVLEWMDYHLRGIGDAPSLDVGFLRDWVEYKGDAAPAVGTTATYPVGDAQKLFLSGADGLVGSAGEVKAGRAAMVAVAAPSSTGGGFADAGTSDQAGTSVSFTSAPLTDDFDVAGVPVLELKLDAPTFVASQGADATRLVLFAKLQDIDAAGETVLPRNLVSNVRVADVAEPIRIELPGIVRRFAKGHRFKLTISTSTASSRGNNAGGPVTVVVDPAAPPTLTIPRLGQPGATGTGPSGTTPYGPLTKTPKAPKVARGAAAATLPTARRLRSCSARRSVVFKLRRVARGDRVRTVKVSVNGKRAKILRRSRGRVLVRKLPRRAFRMTVTVRTKKGRTRMSARTYSACRR